MTSRSAPSRGAAGNRLRRWARDRRSWLLVRRRLTDSGAVRCGHPGPPGALAAAIERWDGLTGALLTVLREASGSPVDASIVDLATRTEQAAADAAALVPVAVDFQYARPEMVVDLVRLLRHDLAQHADRVADLANAGSSVGPAVTLEVARMRTLLDRILREVLEHAARASDRP